MNAQVRSVIGIDIGNSGLRIARLNLPLQDSSSPLDPIGRVARIDWKLSQSQASCSETNKDSGRDFYSDDPTWLAELQRIVYGESLDLDAARDHSANDSFGNNGTLAASAEPEADHWFISSVRRDAFSLLEGYLSSNKKCCVHVINYSDVGFAVDVEFPARVGIDRLLAARAAMAYADERPLIVVQAGSAVTVDWITAQGVFGGGAIVPGVPMMLRLLGQAADMLPDVEASELIDLPQLPGRNTEHAMQCGVSSAVVGGTQHLIERYRAQSSSTVPVILSGGDGPRLARHLQPPIRVIDHLVLRGIAHVAAELLAI